MLNERDKQRQKRHRKRLEAKIDASALVVAICDHCFDTPLLRLVYAMLGELPDQVRSRIHLYGIDAGEDAGRFTTLGHQTYADHGVPLHYVALNDQQDLSSHYNAIDVLMVSGDGEASLQAAKSALSAGCTVIADRKVAQKINLNIKERLRVNDKPCATELSKHLTALATYRRKFDCALAN